REAQGASSVRGREHVRVPLDAKTDTFGCGQPNLVERIDVTTRDGAALQARRVWALASDAQAVGAGVRTSRPCLRAKRVSPRRDGRKEARGLGPLRGG